MGAIDRTRVEAVVFDLGGVLVELDGPPIPAHWMPEGESFEQNWRRWLTSPLTQGFERGEIAPQTFITQLIKQLRLNVDEQTAMEHYEKWPGEFFDGAIEFLQSLSGEYRLAIYSNITELHWPRYHQQLESAGCITHYFASYLMGMAKPDADSFRYVCDAMKLAPEQALFLDDNQLNVEGAQSIGMQAQRVVGFSELRDALSGSA